MCDLVEAVVVQATAGNTIEVFCLLAGGKVTAANRRPAAAAITAAEAFAATAAGAESFHAES